VVKIKEKQKCRFFYEKESEKYDEIRFSCKCRKMYNLLQQEIISNNLNNCKKIIDIGCGTGRFSVYLSKKGHDVISIDLSLEMLKILKQKSKKQNLNIKLVRADIEHLPFKKESFDGISSIFVLRHFKSIDKIISEFGYIIKKQGIITFDNMNTKFKFYDELLQKTGKNTKKFSDYFFDKSYIEKILKRNNFKTQKTTSILKMPMFITHFFTCKLKLKSILYFIKKIEKRFNFGLLIFIKAKKKIVFVWISKNYYH